MPAGWTVSSMRSHLRNWFLQLAGVGFLALAWLKHSLRGYRTPRPFGLNDAERCIAHDWSVVEGWLEALRQYCGDENPFRGVDVLELGPGADLGVAGYLLALGAASYRAADANPLLADPPAGFYSPLLRRVAEIPRAPEPTAIAAELERAHANRGERIRWACDPDFNLETMLEPSSVDIVVSQAAFEHFDDVPRTLTQLARVARPGAVFVAEIDLMTHSRWIRERDPLNIYRYPDLLYRMFHFRGSPNRLRPRDYEAALRAAGWTDVRIQRECELSNEAFEGIRRYLQPRWRGDDVDMRSLSIFVAARRATS